MTDLLPPPPEGGQLLTPFAAGERLPFYRVSPRRAHDIVVDQIVLGVRAGIIPVGSQLPTIEALAALTGVSKPVVGEAVRVLREHGVVSTKRGVSGGITILNDDIPLALLRRMSDWRNATLTELVEARRPVEEELALLAGERGTAKEFDAMRESIRLMSSELRRGSGGSFLRYDHRFHYQIGLAARSEMLFFYQQRCFSTTSTTRSPSW
jgi:DNA-binding FadR family transcriptional regulator